MIKQIKKSNIFLGLALLIIAFCAFSFFEWEKSTIKNDVYKQNNSSHTQSAKNKNNRINANMARPVVDATRPKYPIRFIDNAIIKDIKTGRSFKGTIDLKPTLDRIQKGGKYPHKNDGSVFKNRPNRETGQVGLPKQSLGYYREYVHPTPNISGPGPQRIIIGQGNEGYYTGDHYQTFIRIK